MKAIVALFVFAFAGTVFAHGGGMDDSISGPQMYEMMARMMGTDNSTGNCSMDDHDFEELGDAMMERMMGSADHEYVDDHMDQSVLVQMHTIMGKQSMGCANSSTASSGMMASMMMGMMPQMMRGQMMGYNQAAFGLTWDQLSFIAIILGFIGTWLLIWVKLGKGFGR